MKRKPSVPLPVPQPVLVLFYPPEPCASCAASCCTACPVCRGSYCLGHIYDHHRGH